MRMTLNVRQLETRRRTWKNFSVTVSYRQIDRNGIQIELIRDGVVELVGKRLTTRDQIALRGIFSRVFDKNRSLKMLNERMASDSRLANLFINQFEIRDGWVGISVGTDAARFARKMQNNETIRR